MTILVTKFNNKMRINNKINKDKCNIIAIQISYKPIRMARNSFIIKFKIKIK
jgi:hypothetical protein